MVKDLSTVQLAGNLDTSIRINAFELWCWRRLFRVPWTARRSNQSVLKEISPGCSLEGLMLKLKLQYFGHLMWRVDSLEKTLMLGGIKMTEDEMAGWHHRLDGHEFELTPGVGDGQGGLVCCDSWGCKESDTTERLNWLKSLQSCLTLWNPMNCSTPGLPVHHQLLEFTQTHVHRVSDAIQPSHPLSSPFPLAPNPSQHQSLFFLFFFF